MALDITVLEGDAFTIAADVLVAKYAQHTYGLDRSILSNLDEPLQSHELPSAGQYLLLDRVKTLRASRVLLLGVEPLGDFGYPQIRNFARRALATLSEQIPEARTVLLTLHGAGYGLDEVEAFESEVAGLFDAINAGLFPSSLERIAIVESDARRASKLARHLQDLVPGGQLSGVTARTAQRLPAGSQFILNNAGYASASKPHVFVAMPFAAEFDDLYHYGITNAVKSAGFLCERADMSSFTGDVMNWVQSRIASSRLVIAELTGANPNVYLEVGFAWALRIPTVLLVQSADQLKFDVRSQRVIEYKGSIRSLEERLSKELSALFGSA